MNEKHRRDLVLPVPSAASVRGRKWTKTKMAASLFGALTALCLISHGPSPGPLSMVPMTPLAALPPLRPLPSSVCAQVPPLLPDHSLDSAAIYAAKPRIVEWHQDAIRIPTEVYDEMGAPGEDERWEIFADFHAYLETAYPLTHAVLKRTKVDTWGLVFEWEGTDKDLKPLLLTGHQGG
jgi:Gly-Xaa carboxypeptidase